MHEDGVVIFFKGVEEGIRKVVVAYRLPFAEPANRVTEHLRRRAYRVFLQVLAGFFLHHFLVGVPCSVEFAEMLLHGAGEAIVVDCALFIREAGGNRTFARHLGQGLDEREESFRVRHSFCWQAVDQNLKVLRHHLVHLPEEVVTRAIAAFECAQSPFLNVRRLFHPVEQLQITSSRARLRKLSDRPVSRQEASDDFLLLASAGE